MTKLHYALLPFLAMATSAKAADDEKPNIVFILADDLGYGDLSCYGQQRFRTPNIDSLASSGMRFTRFYSGSTVSAPSRACLLTGLNSGNSPIKGNQEVYPEGQAPIPAGTENIFQMFRRAGYSTAAMGKWGLGYPGSEGDPINQGVDHFYGYNCQRMAHNYYPDHLWSDTVRIELPENADGGYGSYSQDLIHKHALDYLENHKDERFFLYLPYVLPHAELLVPQDSIMDRFRGLYPETAYAGCDEGPSFRKGGYCSQAEPRATFAAMVTRLDNYVGEIVGKLKELGIYNNTIIIFTSDNGPHMEGGADPEFFDSNGIYRGIKRDLYEGGIRVPFIIHWNGITAGTTCREACAFWDILPTFKEIIADTLQYKSDGISLLPLITSQQNTLPERSLYFEFHEDGGSQAVIEGKWKLVILDTQSENPVMELYNLETDPSEKHNLLSEDKKAYRRIRKRLESHL